MPLIGTITSTSNAQIKLARRLRGRKRVRYREGLYLIEGLRLVQHALSRGYEPALAFYTADFAADEAGAELVASLTEGDPQVWEVSPEVMADVTDTVTPQGIAALMPLVMGDPDRVRLSSLVLVLDRIRVPGNLGTILRTALATGIGGVILSEGSVDPFSPKAVRAGMGAHFDLPVLSGANWAQIFALTTGKQCLLAEAEGQVTLWQVDWTQPTALIIGSEAHGAGAEARQLATRTVYIPMTRAAESYNAAIAAAGFMFEAQRQRILAIG